jgi:Holliday junction DNA helicase RuvB
MESLGVNEWGLDAWDQKYLHVLAEFFRGGPAGLDTMSAALSEAKDTLEDVIEPYLLKSGLIQRTARGRKLTDLGWTIVGLSPPS